MSSTAPLETALETHTRFSKRNYKRTAPTQTHRSNASFLLHHSNTCFARAGRGGAQEEAAREGESWERGVVWGG